MSRTQQNTIVFLLFTGVRQGGERKENQSKNKTRKTKREEEEEDKIESKERTTYKFHMLMQLIDSILYRVIAVPSYRKKKTVVNSNGNSNGQISCAHITGKLEIPIKWLQCGCYMLVIALIFYSLLNNNNRYIQLWNDMDMADKTRWNREKKKPRRQINHVIVIWKWIRDTNNGVRCYLLWCKAMDFNVFVLCSNAVHCAWYTPYVSQLKVYGYFNVYKNTPKWHDMRFSATIVFALSTNWLHTPLKFLKIMKPKMTGIIRR